MKFGPRLPHLLKLFRIDAQHCKHRWLNLLPRPDKFCLFTKNMVIPIS